MVRVTTLIAGSAALALLGFLNTGPAQAGSRLLLNLFPFFGDEGEGYYVEREPRYQRRHRFRSEEFFGDENDGEDVSLDEERDSFYEDDRTLAPRRRLDRVEPPLKRDKPVKKRVITALPPPVAKPKPKLLSCDRATKIVTDYGFQAVKASDCHGQVFTFKAQRGDKIYAIKLSSVSGELTEVSRQ